MFAEDIECVRVSQVEYDDGPVRSRRTTMELVAAVQRRSNVSSTCVATSMGTVLT
jgi:hypothetical protein